MRDTNTNSNNSFEVDETLWAWAMCFGEKLAYDHEELDQTIGAAIALAAFEQRGWATAHVDHRGRYQWSPTKAFFRSTGLKAGKTITVTHEPEECS